MPCCALQEASSRAGAGVEMQEQQQHKSRTPPSHLYGSGGLGGGGGVREVIRTTEVHLGASSAGLAEGPMAVLTPQPTGAALLRPGPPSSEA